VGSVEGWVYYMGTVIVEWEGAVLGLMWGRCPVVTNGGLCCVVVRERRALLKLLWGGLVTIMYAACVSLLSMLFRQKFGSGSDR